MLGLRNSRDKTITLGHGAGVRVVVCDSLPFNDAIAIGAGLVLRHCLPIERQVNDAAESSFGEYFGTLQQGPRLRTRDI